MTAAPIQASPGSPDIVMTASGPVAGSQQDGIQRFLGIPYAAPPVGPLRWRAPQSVPAWTHPLNASQYGAACPQPEDKLFGLTPPVQDESCLYLNLWAPKTPGTARPVMVWLHGGANRIGASSLPFYDGQRLAARGVVLVTLNYRLGYFGFFSHPALDVENQGGNFGLMDQIAALRWVRENIAAFGGDPARVTVFGESAGGTDLLYLMSSPVAAGLFQAAIVESAIGWDKPVTREAMQASVLPQLDRIGVPRRIDAAGLRSIPAAQLVMAQGDLAQRAGPFIDRTISFESLGSAFSRGREMPIPLVIGSNDWEGSLIKNLPGDLTSATLTRLPKVVRWYSGQADGADARRPLLFRDIAFAAPARWIAQRHRARAPSYLYRFTYVASAQRGTVPGAGHASELAFVFDNLASIPRLAAAISDQDRALATGLADRWTQFAKSLNPSGPMTPWRPYDPAADNLLLVDGQPREIRTPDAGTLDEVTQMFAPGGQFGER